MSEADRKEYEKQLRELKEFQQDAILNNDLHKVKDVHNRIVKIQRILQEEK